MEGATCKWRTWTLAPAKSPHGEVSVEVWKRDPGLQQGSLRDGHREDGGAGFGQVEQGEGVRGTVGDRGLITGLSWGASWGPLERRGRGLRRGRWARRGGLDRGRGRSRG